MPEIEIDDEVYSRLKEEAEPFVDTPNSVLRRLLRLTGDSGDAPMEPVASAMGRSVRADGAAAMKRRDPRTAKRGQKVRKRVPTGSILREEEYERPLLKALVEAGGHGSSKDVTEAVGRKLADRLTDLDRGPLRSGGIRWENRLQFVRLKMIERGLMMKDSPRGIWAISDEGRQYVEQSQ